MGKVQKKNLIPRDSLNDEGKRNFPWSLRAKVQRRDEVRKMKFGSIETEPEVARELTNDLDAAVSAQQYRQMWILALASALASVASAVAAILAVVLRP